MSIKIDKFNQSQLKNQSTDIRPGDTITVYQKIQEKGKERTQPFEGVVIAKKHGKGVSSTITVRKISSGVGVEKIFPLHSPTIERIEITKRAKVRRSKLYFLRGAKGKKARLKRKDFVKIIAEEKPKEEATEEPIKEEPKEVPGEEPKEEAPKEEKEEPKKEEATEEPEPKK